MRFIIILSCLLLTATAGGQDLNFKEFNEATFESARSQNKLVLLDLKANWCHWCHVMDDSTYSNPEVIKFLNQHFVSTKADQDANPSLANKYRNYGWPATVIFTPDGKELIKKRGYMNPREFLSLLKDLVENPKISSPKKVNEKSDQTIETKKKAIMIQLENFLDYEKGGYAQSQKYVDYDAYEYAFYHYQNPKLKQWIQKSVEGAYHLEDSVWSGIFQYSTHGDWQHIHYEKLLSIQARYIEIFVDHYVVTQSEKSLTSAKCIAKYCDRFLKRPDGLYASAQDADLQKGIHSQAYYSLSNLGRLQRGIPPIDPNTYTQTNAAMAVSLLRLALVTNNDQLEKDSKDLLDFIVNNRKNEKGLFSHSKNKETIALSDNLAMLRAFEVFYNLTKEEKYKTWGLNTLKAMAFFKNEEGSYSDPSVISVISPSPIISENIAACRLLNFAGHLFNKPEYLEDAKEVLSFLLSPKPYSQIYVEGALALAIEECNSKPKNIVIVENNNQKVLLKSLTLNLPIHYAVLEVTSTNTMTKDQKDLFGNVTETTVFSCTENACSAPITHPLQLTNLLL